MPLFPHYTWGYIACILDFWDFSGVPSLYVRVYRAIFPGASVVNCSLTIREGISAFQAVRQFWRPFPHYTWGYIAAIRRAVTHFPVPSLYVRVYRWKLCDGSTVLCSLTIREGISTCGFTKKKFKCSLTIREGISWCQRWTHWHRAFPHYTWGYIIFPHLTAKSTFVPSLYVSVYHPGYPWELQPRGSLTIREGISTGGKTDDFWRTFPYYTWGYIEMQERIDNLQEVPSLYVRVYHKTHSL